GVSVSLVLGGPSGAGLQFYPEQEPSNSALVFGCEPGPVEPFSGSDPPLPAGPGPDHELPPAEATLVVDGAAAGPPIAGAGFNLEHTLWSCPTFRPALRRRLLEPFRPAIVRVDTGQLPFAPDGVSADQLGWERYQRVMAEERYKPSWEFIRRLNRQGVKVMLAVWGSPGAFTDD